MPLRQSPVRSTPAWQASTTRTSPPTPTQKAR